MLKASAPTEQPTRTKPVLFSNVLVQISNRNFQHLARQTHNMDLLNIVGSHAPVSRGRIFSVLRKISSYGQVFFFVPTHLLVGFRV